MSVAKRQAESAGTDGLLSAALEGVSGLVLEGDPGIGKTTVWLTAVAEARAQGFRVLSARPGALESVLAYSGLADLLAGVDDVDMAVLPVPQRLALDRVLLKDSGQGVATDQRAVAAGFLSVVNHLARQSPLLIAVDDLQWLDASSVSTVAFAARRLSGPVAVLGAVRTGADGVNVASWLQLPRPDAIRSSRLRPLSLGALHAVVSERLGRSLPRPKMLQIHEISGGNPLYALELARALDGRADANVTLPESLTELVGARLDTLGTEVRDVLLIVACTKTPTTELVAQVAGADLADVVRCLECAETHGIITFDGNRPRFTHPLLQHGVYDRSNSGRRRWIHQRLASLIEQPELRARQLALAGVVGDPATLNALDNAANAAAFRGAPAAAAEFVDMAVGLGGDTPARRIRSAQHHLDAGNTERARNLLTNAISGLSPGGLRAQALNLLSMLNVLGNGYFDAIETLNRALDEPTQDDLVRTQMLITLSISYLNTGQLDAAARNVEQAISDATRHGDAQLLSQALGIHVLIQFVAGDGLDQDSLQRALDLEDPTLPMRVALRPSLQRALLLAWTGALDQARVQITKVQRSCDERGEEAELIYAGIYSILIETWRGNFTEAASQAEEVVDRAKQLGGDVAVFAGSVVSATLATYAGRVDEARRLTSEATAVGQRSGLTTLMAVPIANLGLLELSLGDHQAALAAVEPLLVGLTAMPRACELVVASFVPDAAESLVALGRLDDAEPWIARLEQNGHRLDRAWMLATGSRCRAMHLAARGDVEAATQAALAAMVHHERLPMPFERARTQMLLGQLQRRRRQKEAASASLLEALQVFEALQTPLWAERARREIARTNVGANTTRKLTPTEWRVAQLTASGMTNRDVAATMFISPKTVEVNLSRIYRKLGIRSRAELGRHVANIEAPE